MSYSLAFIAPFSYWASSTSAQESFSDWIAASNKYTNMLLAVEMKHTPEVGSNQGLSEFDTKVSQPTLADEDQETQGERSRARDPEERRRVSKSRRKWRRTCRS